MISSVGGGSFSFDAVALNAQRRGAESGAIRGKPSLTIHTQEGDTVTITPKHTQGVTYGPPSGSLASKGLASNDQFDVQVTGELSDTEKADIQAVLERMDSARTSLESGDPAGGMQAMRSAMAGGGTVSSVEGPGGPPPGMALMGMQAPGMPGTEDEASVGTLNPDGNADSSSLDALIESLRARDYSALRNASSRS